MIDFYPKRPLDVFLQEEHSKAPLTNKHRYFFQKMLHFAWLSDLNSLFPEAQFIAYEILKAINAQLNALKPARNLFGKPKH